MIKRVLFGLFWTITFPTIYLTISFLLCSVNDWLGIVKKPNPGDITFGILVWILVLWATPIVGLILSCFGILPGTKRKPNKQSAQTSLTTPQ